MILWYILRHQKINLDIPRRMLTEDIKCKNISRVPSHLESYEQTKTKFIKTMAKNVQIRNTSLTVLESISSIRMKSFKQLSISDIFDYYNEERYLKSKFLHPLLYDNKHDMELMKSLFPSSSHPVLTHSNDRIIQQLELKLKEQKPKRILTWQPDPGISDKAMIENKCPVNQCTFTTRTSESNTVDAILYKTFTEG